MTAMALNSLSVVLREAGKKAESEAATRRALEIFNYVGSGLSPVPCLGLAFPMPFAWGGGLQHKLHGVRMKNLDTGRVVALAKADEVTQRCVNPMELHDPLEILAQVVVKNLDTGEAVRLNEIKGRAPKVRGDGLR
jgi:hypothetical protein